MAWQDEMTAILRTMVDDTDETAPTFSDERLEQALIVAARLVLQDLDFDTDFVPNMVAGSILPDPTASATRDESFINLSCTRAACIIDRGAAGKAAGQAIMIRDGSSQVDLRDVFKSKLQIIQKGWCAVYEDIKSDYHMRQRGAVVGAAIVGPFRIFASGPNTLYNTNDPRWVR